MYNIFVFLINVNEIYIYFLSFFICDCSKVFFFVRLLLLLVLICWFCICFFMLFIFWLIDVCDCNFDERWVMFLVNVIIWDFKWLKCLFIVLVEYKERGDLVLICLLI